MLLSESLQIELLNPFGRFDNSIIFTVMKKTTTCFLPMNVRNLLKCFCAVFLSMLIWGCGTTTIEAPSETPTANQTKPTTIIEGDALSINFPGAPNLNFNQKVRRDGRITLVLLGEVVVAGLTPQELESKLLELYDDQIVTKAVSVTITASSYTFYVNGAVKSPGKKISDRPLTALEAIMEAGGPSPTANIRRVVITRQVDGEYINYKLDLKDVLSGKRKGVFFIKPSDIITVKDKPVLF